MKTLEELVSNPRVTIRRAGDPASNGRCIVYWMQRAQRALDNPALDVAVEAANILRQPVVIFFAPVPFYPHANLRHYAFLAQGFPAQLNAPVSEASAMFCAAIRALAREVLRRSESFSRSRR